MRKKILVVDDTPELLESITFSLKMENYEVFPFLTASAALEALANIVPDLIITDLSMPDIDGFEFIKEVRKLEKIKQMPFVIFSARPLSENETTALALGVSCYISKPATIEKLLAEIERTLSKCYEN